MSSVFCYAFSYLHPIQIKIETTEENQRECLKRNPLRGHANNLQLTQYAIWAYTFIYRLQKAWRFSKEWVGQQE